MGDNADEINALAASIAAADPGVDAALSAAVNRPPTPDADADAGAGHRDADRTDADPDRDRPANRHADPARDPHGRRRDQHAGAATDADPGRPARRRGVRRRHGDAYAAADRTPLPVVVCGSRLQPPRLLAVRLLAVRQSAVTGARNRLPAQPPTASPAGACRAAAKRASGSGHGRAVQGPHRDRRHRPDAVRQEARALGAVGRLRGDQAGARRRRAVAARRRRHGALRAGEQHAGEVRARARHREPALLRLGRVRRRRRLRHAAARRGGGGDRHGRRRRLPAQPQPRLGRAAVGEDQQLRRGRLAVQLAVRPGAAGRPDRAHGAPLHDRRRHHARALRRRGDRLPRARAAQPDGADAEAADDGGLPHRPHDRRPDVPVRLLPGVGRLARLRDHQRRARPRSAPASGLHPRGRAGHGAERVGDDQLLQAATSSTTSNAYVARDLWKRSDIQARDVRCAQLYDAFTPLILVSLEEFGFVEPGEAGALRARGQPAVAARPPADQHLGRLALRGLRARLQPDLRGRAPDPRHVDLPGARTASRCW